MSARHAGRVALVTGGASGIGRGVVERLARDGADVVIADVDIAGAEGLAASLAGSPGRVVAVRMDVTDEQSVEAGFDRAEAEFGVVDISVNNAGVITVGPVVGSSVDEWRRVIDVNVIGVYLTMREAGRRMVAGGRDGAIVNASSGAGRRGVPNFGAYCASKAAIIMMSQAYAVEMAPHRVRVNCYTPGHIMTPFWEDIASGYAAVAGITPEAAIDAFLATVPWGRFGTPEDVAATVSWLASDDAEYVSGQCIAMNGAEFPF